MNYATTFAIAAVAFLCLAAATQLPVTFVSPCECRGFRGSLDEWERLMGAVAKR